MNQCGKIRLAGLVMGYKLSMNPKIILPKPPSINHIYGFTSRGGFARSYITKIGREWFEVAGEKIKQQWKKRTPITKDIEVFIELFTSRRQDIDNILKPILDLLQKNGVIENDSQIVVLNVEKYRCKRDGEKVTILVWEDSASLTLPEDVV